MKNKSSLLSKKCEVKSDDRFVVAQNRPQFFKSKLRQYTSNRLETDARFLKMYEDERFGMTVKGRKYDKIVNGKDDSVIQVKNKVTKVKKKKLKNPSKYNCFSERSLDSLVGRNDANDHILVEDNYERHMNKPNSDVFTSYKDEKSHIDYLTSLSRGEIEVITSSDDEKCSSGNDSDKGFIKGLVFNHLGEEINMPIKSNIIEPSLINSPYVTEENKIIACESTPYLALCNMDWNHVRAIDIFVIFSSFSPPGSVNQVIIYPSNFGMEKMLKLEALGQLGIWKNEMLEGKNTSVENKKDKNVSKKISHIVSEHRCFKENISDKININSNEISSNIRVEKDPSPVKSNENQNLIDVEGSDSTEVLMEKYNHISYYENNVESDYDSEKLRAYEKSKLKYYFAFIEFASNSAAHEAFSELDGIEIGHSSASMDLSYVPSKDIINITKGREIKDKASSIPINYKPTDFVIKALQLTDIQCTWEMGDTDRHRMLTQYRVGKKEWEALAGGNDLNDYLACDSETTSSCDDGNCTLRNKRNVKKIVKGAQIRKALGLIEFDCFTDINTQNNEINSKVKGINIKTHVLNKPNQDLEYMNLFKFKTKNSREQDINQCLTQESYEIRKRGKKEMNKIAKKRENNNIDLEINHSKVTNQKEKCSGKRQVSCLRATDKSKSSGKRKNDKLLLDSSSDFENQNGLIERLFMHNNKSSDKKMKKLKKYSNVNDPEANFEIDTTDLRFASMMEGTDDRFNIDITDPNYKNTPAMKLLLAKRKTRGNRNLLMDSATHKDIRSLDDLNGSKDKNSDVPQICSLLRSIKNKIAL